jgi:hypothetical protein
LFGSTGRTIVAAVLAAFLLQYVDSRLDLVYRHFVIRPPIDSDYVAFLVGIGALGGVFIGLYYAGLSAVVGAMYARVPGNVRNLLSQERTGSTYLRFLAFVTFWAFSLVGLHLLGFPAIVLAIPVITVCAGIGVIAFVRLGQRAFDLFDPTALSQSAFIQTSQWLRQVVASGFRWNDAAFQQHAHRQSALVLETIESLADVALREKHLTGRSAIELGERIIQFLVWYDSRKRLIPTDSAWYEAAYEHGDWYKSEDVRVATALQTGTSLQPTTIRKRDWVEEQLLPIPERCLTKNIKQGRYTEALQLAPYIEAYCRVLAGNGRPRRALSNAFSLFAAACSVLSAGGKTDQPALEKIALVERLASVPISLAIAVRESLDSFSPETVIAKLRGIDWRRRETLYLQGFDATVLDTLEWLQARLVNELDVEGRLITPAWYCEELIRQALAKRFFDASESLISYAAKKYEEAAAEAERLGSPWFSAAVISREWEYWHKIDAFLPQLEKTWTSLTKVKRVDGLLWAEVNIDALRSVMASRRKKLVTLMSAKALMLDRGDETSYPDYSGQFLNICADACLDACIANDNSTLAAIFPRYLTGCLVSFDRLRPKGGTDWRAQQEFRVAAAVVLDVMDVSGYAKLLSEVHKDPAIWRTVKRMWGVAIARFGNLEVVLPAATAITNSVFQLPHRGTLRSQWHMQINSVLSELPTKRLRDGGFGYREVADHPSPLVRLLAARPYGTLNDGIDIFVALYLRKWPAFEKADFGLRSHDLRERLENEMRFGR